MFTLFVCVAGLLLWFLAPWPKWSELGRIAFFVGLLVFTHGVAGHIVRLG